MNAFLIIIFALFFNQNQTPSITVTVQTINEAAPVINLTVTFQDEAGQLTGACTTNEQGLCTMFLEGETSGPLIRGFLEVGPAGIRSVTFPSDTHLDLLIEMDPFGHVTHGAPSHAVHATPESFVVEYDPTLATLPPPQDISSAEEMTETEYVVIAPEATVEIGAEETEQTIEEEIIPDLSPDDPARPWPAIATMTAIFSLLLGGLLIYAWYARRGDHV